MATGKRSRLTSATGGRDRHAAARPGQRVGRQADEPVAGSGVAAGPSGIDLESRQIVVRLNRGVLLPALVAMFLAALLLGQAAGWLRLPPPPAVDATSGLAMVFLAGVLAGGLSCLAVQGGLLATAIAQGLPGAVSLNGRLGEQAVPVLSFLVAKIVAYTGLGFALGYLGSFVALSPLARGLLQVAVGVFMVIMALQLLDIHPVFRRLTITAPKPMQRLIRRQSRRGGNLAPLALGVLTVFIPCGVTQAMELVAMATADPWRGAAVMFSFTLGTAPLFFVLGLAASRLGQSWRNGFRYLSAAVLVLAAWAILGGLRITGLVPLRSANVVGAPGPASVEWAEDPGISGTTEERSAAVAGQMQEVNIQVLDHGYIAEPAVVKAGVPIRLKLVTEDVFSCSRAFTIPSLGIERILPSTGVEYIDLPPQSAGRLAFVCSMGMYGGTIEVRQ